MEMLKTMVSSGEIASPMDTIEHEGKLWLVPEWKTSHDKGWRTPARIICLSDHHLQKLDPMLGLGADYGLIGSVPNTVLQGLDPRPEASGFVVIEAPPIRFPR
jgi:hypothetical protein